MQNPLNGAGAHKAPRALIALITVVGIQLAATAPALAQPAPAAPAAKDAAPSEAARRAAESPYRFILQNAAIRERPRQAAAPAAAPEREAPRRPAASEQTIAAVPARSAPAAEPSPASVAPEPAAPTPVALASPQAKPAPVVAARKELIPIKQDAPELSAALLREQPTGRVTVAFDVMPDGNVTGVKVTHSSNTRLNRPSMQAVQGWKFQPIDEVRQLEIELNYN